MKSRKKRGIALTSAAVLGILFAFAGTCSFSKWKAQGDSMAPAIQKGERVWINKLAYLFGKPQQGELVAFHCDVYSEDGEGSTLVKRVAATEGDSVEIKDGTFYVNGRVYNEFAAELVYMEPMEEVTVKEGEVFVLSDDRSAALDSRDSAVGTLKISELTGKVCFK